MKLLVILSIEEYSDVVRKIMARKKIPVYSETEIRGCRCDNLDEMDPTNWFVSRGETIYSHLFFVFNNEATGKRVLNEIEEYNKAHEGVDEAFNPIHAYQLNVEDYT